MGTVISKAKELVATVGKDEAIKYFENKIKEFGVVKNFEDLCVVSGWETAIAFIKDEINDIIKNDNN